MNLHKYELTPYFLDKKNFTVFPINNVAFPYPTFGKDEVFYAKFTNDNKLRAFKVLKVFYGQHIILLIQVAGFDSNDLMYIIYGWGCWGSVKPNREIFKSVEDFRANKPAELFSTTTFFHFEELARACGNINVYNDKGWTCVTRFAADGTNIISKDVTFAIEFTIGKTHPDIIDVENVIKDYPYTTSEKAKESAQVDVVEFDDVTVPHTMVVEITRKIKVVAASTQYLLKRGKEVGETNVRSGEKFKVFIDGELLYESE